MSDQIETSHLGFKITFADNEEVWRCWDLDMSHASLAKLKAKIAAHERKFRKKAEALEVWKMPDYTSNAPTKAWVVSVDRDGKRCWVMVESAGRGGNGKREREKCDIAHLLPMTPENDAIMVEIIRLTAVINETHSLRRAAEKGLTRHTKETLEAASPGIEVES